MADHDHETPCLPCALRKALADFLDANPETDARSIAAALGCVLGEIMHLASEEGKAPPFIFGLIQTALVTASMVCNQMNEQSGNAPGHRVH